MFAQQAQEAFLLICVKPVPSQCHNSFCQRAGEFSHWWETYKYEVYLIKPIKMGGMKLNYFDWNMYTGEKQDLEYSHYSSLKRQWAMQQD